MEKKDFYILINGYGLPDQERIEGLRAIVDEFSYFQVAQIYYLKNLKEFNQNIDGELNKIAVSVPDRKKLYRFLNTKTEIKPDTPFFNLEKDIQTDFISENNEDIQSKDSLIDKFLASDTGSLRQKEGSDNKYQNVENEIISNSVKEDEEVVTETLAIIYLQQKKYDKALNAFHKLSLKYPEKSVYFASRIKEIERLKNI